MIAYLDSSVLVANVLLESGLTGLKSAWERADNVVSSLLIRPEASAAVQRATRAGRVTAPDVVLVRVELTAWLDSITSVAVDADIANLAADLAERESLRGCDAVHLATALRLRDPDVVFLTLDRDLAEAARRNGLAVAA